MVTVRGILQNPTQHFGKAVLELGNFVWLESDGVHIIVSTKRTQTFHTEVFTALGLDPKSLKYIVVKSSQHFYDSFTPIASEVIHMATPGAIPPDYTTIPYTKRDGNFWPKTENPFAK